MSVENFFDLSASFPSIIRPGILYRSADPTFADFSACGSPKTVINLRYEPDEPRWALDHGCIYLHSPIANKIEKYDTTQEEVRKWLAVTLRLIATAEAPILLHCRAGRDRTGIVVAVLLKILMMSDKEDESTAVATVDECIVQDYMKVEGSERRQIEMTMSGLQARVTAKSPSWLRSYFRKENIPVEKLKEMFLLPT